MRWEGKTMKRKRTESIPLVVSVILVFACVLLCAGPARAEFPERPVTVVVGMEAGGATDVSVRAMAIGTGAALGKAVMVENKGGGGGTVALGVLTTAKPDGYMLVACQNVSIVDTPLMQKVPFKPLASITPICAFAGSEHTALLVKSDARASGPGCTSRWR
jgi:tripartite-type tricarboxylate transporter receptor subunit TctC